MKKKLFVILFAVMLFVASMKTANAATIRVFDEEGGNQIAEEYTSFNANTVELEEPTKENHVFEGWVTDGWYMNGPFGPSTPSTDGVTIDGNSVTTTIPFRQDPFAIVDVYATWTRVYTITYILDGGQAEGNPESYTEYDEFTITDPTKDGYEFLGWLDEEGENLGKDLFFEEGTTGDITLTAAWKKNPEVVVTESGTKTVVTNNPKTGDNILFNICLVSVSFVSLIGITVLDKYLVKNN